MTPAESPVYDLNVSQGIAASPALTLEAPAAELSTWRKVLPWTSFWITMGLCFGLTAWMTRPNRLPTAGWYIMAQVSVLIVVFFEELIPRNKANSLFRDHQSWNDIGHMLLFKLVFRPLVWMLALWFIGFASHHLPHLERVWPSRWPVALQFLALLAVFDLVGYGYHRTLHRYDWMFAFHSLHHDTENMHVLKSNRLHVGEEVINFMLLVPAMILLGCPTGMMIWLGMWEVFEGNLSHSNVDQRFPRWFHYLVRTIDVHYIHHSADGRQMNSNFGGFPIWDIVFGTYLHPFDNKVSEYGLRGYPTQRGFLAQLWFPLQNLIRRQR